MRRPSNALSSFTGPSSSICLYSSRPHGKLLAYATLSLMFTTNLFTLLVQATPLKFESRDLYNFKDDTINEELSESNFRLAKCLDSKASLENETGLAFGSSSFKNHKESLDRVNFDPGKIQRAALFDRVPHVFVLVRNRIVDHARGLDHENDVYDALAEINVCPHRCSFFTENHEHKAKVFQQIDGGLIYLWEKNTEIKSETNSAEKKDKEKKDIKKENWSEYNGKRGKLKSPDDSKKELHEAQTRKGQSGNALEDWAEKLYEIELKEKTGDIPSQLKTADQVDLEILITYKSSAEGLLGGKEHSPTRYEAARFLSHLKTIRYAYYSKYNYVVLLEGDIHLEQWNKCSGSKGADNSVPVFSIDDLVKTLPSDWKILQLGYLLKSPVKTMQYQDAWANSVHVTKRVHASSDMSLQGAHAYAISTRGMQEILSQYWPGFDKEEAYIKENRAYAAGIKHLHKDVIIDIRKLKGSNVLELSHILYNRDGVFTSTCPIFPYPLSLEYTKPNSWEPFALATFQSISSIVDRKSFEQMVMMDLDKLINTTSRHSPLELRGNIDYIWFSMGNYYTALATPVTLDDLEKVTKDLCSSSKNFELCIDKFRIQLQHTMDASSYLFMGNRKKRDEERDKLEDMIRKETDVRNKRNIALTHSEIEEKCAKIIEIEHLKNTGLNIDYEKSYGTYLFLFQDRFVGITWQRGIETCYEMTLRFCEEVTDSDPFGDRSSCQAILTTANKIDNREIFLLSKERRSIRPRYIPSVPLSNSSPKIRTKGLDHVKYDKQGINRDTEDASNPVSIIWHIAKLGSVWQDIVYDQWRLIINSGLLDAVDHVYMSYLGSIAEDPLVDHPKVTSILASENVKDYEFPTLDLVSDYCQLYPTGKLLYIHNKGASVADVDPAVFLLTQEWRQILEEYTIYRYEDCLRLLDTYVESNDELKGKFNTCGALWNEVPVQHYSGNFWWASCKYIRTLKSFSDSERRNRFYAEDWLSSGGKKETIDPSDNSTFGKANLNEDGAVSQETVDWLPISCFDVNVDLYHTKVDQSVYRNRRSTCMAM